MQVRDEAMHLTVIYGLHNNTDKDHSLPSVGEFMIVNSANKGLDSIEGVTWDATTHIPTWADWQHQVRHPQSLSFVQHNRSRANG